MNQTQSIEEDVAKYWAPKVKPQSIRRLYETDAKGIVDEDLINDVGFAPLPRFLLDSMARMMLSSPASADTESEGKSAPACHERSEPISLRA